MGIRDTIIEAIGKAVMELRYESPEGIALETPEVSEHGDYSSNIAMQVFAKLKTKNEKRKTTVKKLKTEEHKSPRELAEKIKDEILRQAQDDKTDLSILSVVSNIEVAGPGFINFHLNNDVLLSGLIQIDREKEDYGKTNNSKGKKVIVEYSSPNIAKPFTVGHLRSTIIGDAIANLLEAVGYEVYRDNHLGDWGTQFGKQIYAIKNLGEGETKNLERIEKSKNPVKELVGLYVEFHKKVEEDPTIEEAGREWFKRLEDGDKEARELWQKCIDWSWKEFDRIYNLLGVKFSKEFNNGRGLGESFFEDKMPAVIKELEEKGLLKEGEGGAKLVFFDEDKYPPAMILKKDGASLYHTRDLATDKYRLDNFGKDVLIVNEVGLEQSLYFKQLFEMEKMLGWLKLNQRVHIGHGLIRFKEGKMSTRKGNVIWLEEILTTAFNKARDLRKREKPFENKLHGSDLEIQQIDKDIAIGSLKYNDLKRDPKTNIVFDWDEMLNMQGNSGPYLQYTYARTQSVLSKRKAKNEKLKTITKNLKLEKEEKDLLRAFIKFPEIVVEAAERYSPNLICNYLFDLAQKFNTFYTKHRILESVDPEQLIVGSGSGGAKKPHTTLHPQDTSSLRLMLTKATGQILSNGLNLLGIQAPERM